MTTLLGYGPEGPVYEKTRGAETNNKIVWGNFILGLLAASFWGIFSWITWIAHPNTPSLIKVPVLVTTLLLLDRAAWMLCHTLKNATVTDSSGAYSFERTSFLLPLLLSLISKSYEELSDGQCEPKPVIGTILNNGKAIIVKDTGDNTLDFCDFIQNEATPTLMWALCTVPLLLLLGAGWKTLKATSKQSKKETVWLPIVSNLGLLLTAIYCLFKLAKLYRLLITAKLTFWWSHLLLKLWIRKIRKKNQ